LSEKEINILDNLKTELNIFNIKIEQQQNESNEKLDKIIQNNNISEIFEKKVADTRSCINEIVLSLNILKNYNQNQNMISE
jgi:hypothetical protein